MDATAQRAGPTIADARRAATCLCERLDPGVVLLYGSVARGDQQPDSDLDLVLVFDDLGDYRTRWALTGDARRVVHDATGFDSDVRVTDRAEWEVRTTRCRSSFEAHVAGHAVTLTAREPHAPVDLDKKIGKPPTDAAQAVFTLENTIYVLDRLSEKLRPGKSEEDAFLAGDLQAAEEMMSARMRSACAKARVLMETYLKGLMHALECPHPGRIHNIGGLFEAAGSHALTAGRLDDLLGDITPEDASLWRETLDGYFNYDHVGDHAHKATVEFTTAMIHAATKTATRCVELMTLALGEEPATATDVTEWCARIEGKLAANTLDGSIILPPGAGLPL